MDNELNKKIPNLFRVMSSLSSLNFVREPKKNYFESMTELYLVIGGKNGGTQPIVSFLHGIGLILKINAIRKGEVTINGAKIKKGKLYVCYDTPLAKKMVKESDFIHCAVKHGITIIG